MSRRRRTFQKGTDVGTPDPGGGMGKESGPVAPGNPREAGQWEQGPAGSREDQSSEEGRCMALQRGPGG